MKTIFVFIIALIFSISRLLAILTTPVMVAPASGSIGQTPNVMLDWNTITGATYELKFGTDAGMTVFNQYSTANTYFYTNNLLFGTTYYWQVRAVSTAPDSSNWSTIWSFTTTDYLGLVAPANGAFGQSPDVMIDWVSISGVTNYQYELDVVSSFDSPFYQTGNTLLNTYFYTSNLLFNQTYYWRARAMHAADSTSWSATWSFATTDYIGPVAPSNGATGQNPNVMIDWSGLTGVTNYQYEIDVVSTFDSPLFQTGNTGSTSYFNTSNLFFSQTYYWRARAMHATDTTSWSVTWSFTTTDYIGIVAPTNGAAGQNPNVMIDWSGNTGVTNYQYQIDTVNTFDSPLFQTGNTGSTSYYNTSNLYFNETYYWRARGMHTTDTTSWSVTASFTVTDYVGPVAPSNGATYQYPNVMIDWSGITGSTNYQYEIDTVNSFDSPEYQTGNTATTSYFNTSSLLFGETYYWRARAMHAADTSSWSVTWSFSTADILAHTSPTDGSTNVAPDVLIDWSLLSGITNYDYAIDTTPAFNSPLYEYNSITGSSSQINLANLRFGTKYWWKVRARHSQDTTQWSVPWTFITTDILSNVSPASGATNQLPNVTIDWSFLSGIIYYDYEIDTTPSFNSALYNYTTLSNASSQAELSNLHFSKTYYWHARARHNIDTTQWSATWNFTVTPIGINHVTPADGASNISLNPVIDWSPMSGITNYHYQYDVDPNFSSPTYFSIGISSSQATLSNLSYGETYYWQVRVAHSADTSIWTNPWHFTTLFQLTTQPILSSPADGSIGLSLPVTIEWLAYTGATFYQYEIDTSTSFLSPVLGNTTNLTEVINGLSYSETYYWRIRANNGSGFSPWSVTWSFSTGGILAPVLISPADGSTDISVSTVNLDWNDVSLAISYEYEYSTDIGFLSNVVSGSVSSSDASIGGLNYSTTYYWRVRVYDGIAFSSWSVIWSFTTEVIPLDAVILHFPGNNSTNMAINGLLFNWYSVVAADEYEFAYSPDINFTFSVTTLNNTDTFLTLSGLQYNLQYYWRVRAKEGASNYGTWSVAWAFTTENDPFGAPTLLTPSDGATGQLYNGLLLDWSDVIGAINYEYHYSTDSTFTTYSAGNETVSQATVNGLLYLTKYFWRVRAFNGSMLSDWSDTLCFTTQDDVSGITEIDDKSVIIYPNPASDFIFFKSDKKVEKIIVYNLTGEQIKLINIKSLNQGQVDINKLSSGSYFLKIYFFDGSYVTRLFENR
ncbi:MAG: T9SS type A sorting domain-containing protein [Bacteroidota bacterium]